MSQSPCDQWTNDHGGIRCVTCGWTAEAHETANATQHCPTCICGKRAPVQASRGRAAGSIAWSEHLLAWSGYAAKYPGQSAERIAERGGFGFGEIVDFLGHEPTTWMPR